MSHDLIKLIYIPNPLFPFIPMPPLSLGILTGYLRSKDILVEQDDLHIKIWREYTNRPRFFSEMAYPEYASADPQEFLGSATNHQTNGDRFIKQAVSDMCSQLAIDIKGARLIGFSLFPAPEQIPNPYFVATFHFIEKMRESARCPIVIGGRSLNTELKRTILQSLPYIDFIISGDSREPLLQLLRYIKGEIQFEEIPNIGYIKKGMLF